MLQSFYNYMTGTGKTSPNSSVIHSEEVLPAEGEYSNLQESLPDGSKYNKLQEFPSPTYGKHHILVRLSVFFGSLKEITLKNI